MLRAESTPATRRMLLLVQVFVGASAVVGGALLIARPDGSLLAAKRAALSGSPFHDWRLPGLALLVLVGLGYLGAAALTWERHRAAAAVGVLAGVGLIAFEGVELAWIGFQPLEAVFALVGAIAIFLAWVS